MMLWTCGALGKAAYPQPTRALCWGHSHSTGGWAVTQGSWVVMAGEQKVDMPSVNNRKVTRSPHMQLAHHWVPLAWALRVYLLGREFPKTYPGMRFSHGGKWHFLKIEFWVKLENISWKRRLRNLDMLGKIATFISKIFFTGAKNLGVKEGSNRQVKELKATSRESF